MAEFFALGQPCGLLADVRMAAHRRVERLAKRLRVGAHRGRLCQEVLSLLRKRFDRLAQLQELLFGVAHQLHEDLPLSATLATKTPHDLF